MVFYNLSHSVKKKIALIVCSILLFPGALLAQDEHTTAEDFAVLRTTPDSLVAAWKKDKAFAYANDPEYWYWQKLPKEPPPPFLWGWGPYLRIIFYLLLVTALIYVIYRLVVANRLHLFYSSPKKVQGDIEEGDINRENLDEKINEAVKMQQYRVAIRYMYLKVLSILDEKGWIRFDSRSTNNDYINAMNKRSAGNEFKLITRNYEYVWYGEFELNEKHFDYLNNKFEQFYKGLHK